MSLLTGSPFSVFVQDAFTTTPFSPASFKKSAGQFLDEETKGKKVTKLAKVPAQFRSEAHSFKTHPHYQTVRNIFFSDCAVRGIPLDRPEFKVSKRLLPVQDSSPAIAERLFTEEGSNGAIYCGYGSTVFHRSAPDVRYVLDAGCVHKTKDGVVISVGDGCGRGDESINKSIAKTASIAVTVSSHLMAEEKFSSLSFKEETVPPKIKAALLKLAKTTEKAILSKNRGEQQSTLTTVRVFPHPDKEVVDIIGFSIGDTTALVINPDTGKTMQLAILRRSGGTFQIGRTSSDLENPANVEFIYQRLDTATWGKHPIIVAMTDGISNHFGSKSPSEEHDVRFEVLDMKAVETLLSGQKFPLTPKTVTDTLLAYSLSQSEKEFIQYDKARVALDETISRFQLLKEQNSNQTEEMILLQKESQVLDSMRRNLKGDDVLVVTVQI